MQRNEKDVLTMQPKMSIAHAANFLGISMQAAHKQLKLKNITCPRFGNKFYLTHFEAKKLFDIQFDRKIIVGQIVKGGTGKTTTIENVSSCANTYGARILKIDADPQGNLTDACGIDPENLPVLIDIVKGEASIKDSIINLSAGIDLLPSRIENVVLDNVLVTDRLRLDTFYEDLIKPIADDYDFIFIDCPPTMGQAVTAASLIANMILAPLNPDKFSAKGLKILKNEIETLSKIYKKEIQFKVFLNKFSSKTILSDKAVMTLLSDPVLEGKILNTTVQFSQDIPNITDTNRNLFSSLKNSPPRDDFDGLTRELLSINPAFKKISDEKLKQESADIETIS